MIKVTLGNDRVFEGDDMPALTIAMDQSEGKGEVILLQAAYGFEVIMPQVSPDPVAFLDFFYFSKEGSGERRGGPPGPAQIIIHSPFETADALGRVRFFPEATVVDFDMDASEYSEDGEYVRRVNPVHFFCFNRR